jgi:hypothetical protein
MSALLAVDLGLRTGLALYSSEGRLIWYRSKHFSTSTQLRRAVFPIFEDLPFLLHLVLEGGGNLARIWTREAERRGVSVVRISAETWREQLLYSREQRSGVRAKEAAARQATRIITWSGAPLPTALRHDTAEAILIGFWGVLQVGLLESLPGELRR